MSEAMLHEAEKLLHCREMSAAIKAFDQAQPTADANRCAGGRWLAHMLRGDFKAAWQESDAIRASGVADPHRFWNGEELEGKRVILRCLHGLGDAVQFFRYVPLLRKRTASLVIEVPPNLIELAPYFRGVDKVITWGDGAPDPPPLWDVQIEVNELPYIFRTVLEELPIAERYLELPRHLQNAVRLRPSDQASLKVGLVWASGGWNPSRSIPLEVLEPLFDVAGCEFWNLQGGRAREGWLCLPASEKLHEAEECRESLPALAALVQQLDLIITTDTLVAHLGGSMGRPVCVMLERAADWRWMHGRSDSPWYPTLQLYRQQRDGDWPCVVRRVAETVQERVIQHRTLQLVA